MVTESIYSFLLQLPLAARFFSSPLFSFVFFLRPLKNENETFPSRIQLEVERVQSEIFSLMSLKTILLELSSKISSTLFRVSSFFSSSVTMLGNISFIHHNPPWYLKDVLKLFRFTFSYTNAFISRCCCLRYIKIELFTINMLWAIQQTVDSDD